jgi:hypothetical protein
MVGTILACLPTGQRHLMSATRSSRRPSRGIEAREVAQPSPRKKNRTFFFILLHNTSFTD